METITPVMSHADHMITEAYMHVHHFILAGMHALANSDYMPKEHIHAAAREFHNTMLPIVQAKEKDLPVYNVLNHISFNIVVVWVGFALALGTAAAVMYGWTLLQPIIVAAGI